MNYDYLIVGAGLFGSVFAHEAKAAGKRVLVIDRRPHIAGNVYCRDVEGIHVHEYGAHIFHTNNKEVWDYVNRFSEFNRFTNSPVANFRGELYSLPFNMYTFNKMWGVVTPKEAEARIEEQRKGYVAQKQAERGLAPDAPFEPENLEEQAISLIGVDIYEKLIKGYTEKQWGRSCTELPSFIIRRLPVRLTFDNNYFDDEYQGIPKGGYNVLIDALLDGIEVRTGVDYNRERASYLDVARKVVYTGPIDEYFGYRLGHLAYRGLHFETERYNEVNHQGVAVMNYTDRETPYTRTIEHKHFEFGRQPVTYVTKEYPAEWQAGQEAYYPVNDEANQELYRKYAALARHEYNVIFGGRLAEYKYYDMDDVIASALAAVEREGYHAETNS